MPDSADLAFCVNKQAICINKLNSFMSILSVDWACRGRSDGVSADLSMWRKAYSEPKPSAQYFRCAMAQTHAAVAWSVDLSRQFQINQVTWEDCFPSAYHELSSTGQARLSLSLSSVFLPILSLHVHHQLSLSLIPPSLQRWPTFQLTCLCKLPCAPVTKRGTKGKPNLYRTCATVSTAVVRGTLPAAPPLFRHCNGVSNLTKQVTTLTSKRWLLIAVM